MEMETKKIKIALLFFFLIATFGISISIMAQESSVGNKNIFLDSDQDGLSDSEESSYKTDPQKQDTDGDGYSDGAEIKSGYNPLKPAPGDKIVVNPVAESGDKEPTIETSISSGGNLTEEMTAKIAALVSNGEDGEKQISMEAINSLIEESISVNTEAPELPAINEEEIKIKDQDYSDLKEEEKKQKLKEDQEEYLSAIFYIVANNLPNDISDESAMREFSNEIMTKMSLLSTSSEGMDYFNNLADKGQIILDQMKTIEVPEDMLDTHKKGLQLALYSISLKDKIKVDMNDPIGSMVSLSSAESLMTMSLDFFEEVEGKLSESGAIPSISTLLPNSELPPSSE